MEEIEEHKDWKDGCRFQDEEVPFVICEIAVRALEEFNHTVDGSNLYPSFSALTNDVSQHEGVVGVKDLRKSKWMPR
jgi:hypothetical protein